MSKIVLDASALLALLNNEAGSEKLTLTLLSASVMSTVNLAEVHGRLVRTGIEPNAAWNATLSPVYEIAAFTADQARTAGTLIAQTQALGLSLGDRACLALALSLDAPVYTADRTWKKLRLNIPIHIIR